MKHLSVSFYYSVFKWHFKTNFNYNWAYIFLVRQHPGFSVDPRWIWRICAVPPSATKEKDTGGDDSPTRQLPKDQDWRAWLHGCLCLWNGMGRLCTKDKMGQMSPVPSRPASTPCSSSSPPQRWPRFQQLRRHRHQFPPRLRLQPSHHLLQLQLRQQSSCGLPGFLPGFLPWLQQQQQQQPSRRLPRVFSRLQQPNVRFAILKFCCLYVSAYCGCFFCDSPYKKKKTNSGLICQNPITVQSCFYIEK